ncbi:MAG: BatD family protein [Chitinophagaceae bacterium]
MFNRYIIRPLRYISLTLFVTIFLLPLQAQVKFYAIASEGPFIPGEAFQVQYVAEGARDIQQFTIPSFKNFLVLDSFDSKSTSIQSPGLRMTEVYSKIVVLSAKKAGRFILPAAVALIDGKKRRTEELKIDVVSKRTIPVNTVESIEEVEVEQNSQLREGEDIDKKIKKNLFVKASINKNSCYAGETVMLTYKMYSRLDVSSQILKRPSLTGLSILEMEDSYDGKPTIEKIGGVLYYVNLIRKVQGFPLQAGIIPLDKAEIASTVHFVKVNEPKDRSTSDRRLTYSLFDYPVTLTSAPLSLEVKPLPTNNQPQNFLGAVGDFSLHIEVAAKEIHAGDLTKIRLIIKGTGNLPLLVPPLVQWPNGVDTAEPEVKEEFDRYVFPLKGIKIFEYSFTAPDTGMYTIPSIELVYFNTATRLYNTSRTEPLKMKVIAAPERKKLSEQQSLPAIDEERIPRERYWFGVLVLLIAGWIGFQFWRSKKVKTAGKIDQGIVNPYKESDYSTLLEQATVALNNENSSLFYHEIEQSIWKLTAQYCAILPSGLNKQNISLVLKAKGISDETINSLIEILNRCEWALYAPRHEQSDAQTVLTKTQELFKKITSA